MEAIEIEMKHVESEANVCGRRASARTRVAGSKLPERAMQGAPMGGAGFERLRVKPAEVAGAELRADQAAADTAAGTEAGMVLDMRLSFAGRCVRRSALRFGNSRPAVAGAAASLREGRGGVNESAAAACVLRNRSTSVRQAGLHWRAPAAHHEQGHSALV
jgi:hypothetical protein